MQFTKSNLPDTIDTVEELVVWGASILAEAIPEQTVLIDRANPSRTADIRPVFLDQQSTDPDRLAVSIFFPLQPDYRTKKPWFGGIKSLTTLPLPSAYTATS